MIYELKWQVFDRLLPVDSLSWGWSGGRGRSRLIKDLASVKDRVGHPAASTSLVRAVKQDRACLNTRELALGRAKAVLCSRNYTKVEFNNAGKKTSVGSRGVRLRLSSQEEQVAERPSATRTLKLGVPMVIGNAGF